MADVSLAGFRAKYPEFDDPVASDEDVNFALELAQEIHGCSANAIYALTAHFLVLAGMTGTGGGTPATSTLDVVKKKRVGRVVTEYVRMSATNVEDSYYETTPYGQMFLALKNAALKRLATRVY
jgi:UDP-N-acetylmuramyl tripeptide synthase